MLVGFLHANRDIFAWKPSDMSGISREVDERAFLFGGKCGANVHHFALRVARVYEDLLGALHWLKRPSQPFGVRCFLSDLLPDDCKLLGGDDYRGVIIALNLAFIGALEGGANGDDPTWSQHL